MKVSVLRQNKGPRIIFSILAISKIIEAVKQQPIECMWLGLVEKQNNDIFFVKDTVFAPQKNNTGVYVETDENRYDEWLNKHFTTVAERKSIRLHGHSHVHMGVTPSSVDTNLVTQLVDTVSDFFIQLIINKKGEYTLNMFDKAKNLFYEGIDMEVAVGPITGMFKANSIYLNITHKDILDKKIFQTKTKHSTSIKIALDDDTDYYLDLISREIEVLYKDFSIISNTIDYPETLKKEVENELKEAIAKPTVPTPPYTKPSSGRIYGPEYAYGVDENEHYTPPTKSPLTLEYDYPTKEKKIISKKELKEITGKYDITTIPNIVQAKGEKYGLN